MASSAERNPRRNSGKGRSTARSTRRDDAPTPAERVPTPETPPRGSGARRTEKLAAILRGTERLMLEEGYGAVTFRSVADQAQVAAGLVQYYFPAIDDLFIAVLRQSTERVIQELTEAGQSDAPLRAIWPYANNRVGTALLMEFLALANHRSAVRSVIGEGGERVRQALLAAVSSRWNDYGLDHQQIPPAAVLFLMSCIPRMIVLEETQGTFTGHAETVALVERFLDRVEPT
jgi:AcrR family transcriptional regulator